MIALNIYEIYVYTAALNGSRCGPERQSGDANILMQKRFSEQTYP